MRTLRKGVSFLFILPMTIACVHADEGHPASDNGDAVLATRVTAWYAGAVTAGEPALLRVAFDSPESSCGGAPCFARGGVAGVEVRRAGSSVYVGVPERGKLATMFGWIPASRWHRADSSPQPAAGWVGVWQNETARITIQSMGNDQLDVKGHAVRDVGLGTGGIYGDFTITGKPENGVVAGAGDDSGCEAFVRLLGSYLVIADNGACGGMGVSFSGMYRLRHH